MRIGILGAGMIGGTLGALFAKAGHDVLVASRSTEKRDALIARIGAKARATSVDEAVSSSEVVLLAVPLAAVPELGEHHRAQFANKVVLDACNPFRGRDGDLADRALDHAKGSAGFVADALGGGAHVVKAFNTVYFKTLETEAHREGERVGIPLATDHADALTVVEQLVRDAGFDPVHTGALETCKRFEVCLLYTSPSPRD